MTLPHKRVWAKPSYDSWDQYGHWYRDGAGGGTEYIRADIAEALVLAAFEAAAKVCTGDEGRPDKLTRSDFFKMTVHEQFAYEQRRLAWLDADEIRKLTIEDARAALKGGE